MYFFIHLIFIRNNLKEKAKGKLIIIKEKTYIHISYHIEGRLYFKNTPTREINMTSTYLLIYLYYVSDEKLF